VSSEPAGGGEVLSAILRFSSRRSPNISRISDQSPSALSLLYPARGTFTPPLRVRSVSYISLKLFKTVSGRDHDHVVGTPFQTLEYNLHKLLEVAHSLPLSHGLRSIAFFVRIRSTRTLTPICGGEGGDCS
jgi:hypothetical protein